MSEEKKTLIQKLISVYERIDHIDKRGRNSAQSYNYVKATDLAHAVRNALLELGVYAQVIFTDLRQYTIARAEGKAPFTANDVRCDIQFWDADSNQTMHASGLGTGADSSDKAIYKAQTGALKYALRNAFLVPDEADPEEDESVDEQPEQRKKTERPKNPSKNEQAGKQPPKAEIPNEGGGASVSEPATAVASSVKMPKFVGNPESTLPSSDELSGYRKRFGDLVSALTTEGLKSSAKLPLAKKVLTFLLYTTGAHSAETLSKQGWDWFFEEAGKVAKRDGMKNLVEMVNASCEM